jgi:flagellar basal body-associated protein FliL
MEILIVSVVMLVGVIYGYFTLTGSGIAEHPYRDTHAGAPGAFAPASVFGRDESISINTWSRGTR